MPNSVGISTMQSYIFFKKNYVGRPDARMVPVSPHSGKSWRCRQEEKMLPLFTMATLRQAKLAVRATGVRYDDMTQGLVEKPISHNCGKLLHEVKQLHWASAAC